MKKIIDYRYLEYLKNLLEQYKSATGSKKISLNDLLDSKTCSEFDEWLCKRKENMEDYKKMLNCTADINTKMCAGVYLTDHIYEQFDSCEFGKGPVDSLVETSSASVISPVNDLFCNNRRRINFNGNLDVIYGRPFIRKNDNTLERISGIKTFITQNPYDFSMVKNISDIHNSGRGRVVFGVYGSVNDKDRYKKIREFNKIALKFTFSPNGKYYAYIMNDESFGNKTYFAYVISKNTNDLNRYVDEREKYQKEENNRIIRYAKSLKRGK